MPLLPPQINFALFAPQMEFTQNLGLTRAVLYMGCFTKNPPFRNSPRTYGIHFLIKIVYHKCGVFSIFRTILLYLSYFFFDFSLYQFGYQFTNLLPIICEMFCHFYSNIVIYKIFYPIFFYRLPLCPQWGGLVHFVTPSRFSFFSGVPCGALVGFIGGP